MTSVVVKITTFNQCGMIWNKITVVAVMLLALKKKNVLNLGKWKEDQTFLKVQGSVVSSQQTSAG